MSSFTRHFVRLLTVLTFFALIISLCMPAYALLPDYEITSSYKSGQYYQNLLNVRLTGDMRKDILAVAESQVGYHEGDNLGELAGICSGGNNFTEYCNFYNYFAGTYYDDHYNYQGCGWCGMFVSFCAYMAKIPQKVLHLSAQTSPVEYGMYGSSALPGAQYKTLYDLKINGGSYVPQPGDIIYFGRSASRNPLNVTYCHIGIVRSVDISYDEKGQMEMTINTIEGNSSDKVNEKHWHLRIGESGYATGWIYSNTYIAGFGIPNYSNSGVVEEPVSYAYDIGAYAGSLLRENSKGLEVYKLQHALSIMKAAGVISSSVSRTGTFGSSTVKAVKEYQEKAGLEVDALVGRNTWSSLREQIDRIVKDYDGDFIMDGSTLLFYKGEYSEVVLPDGCTTIAALAFNGSSVTSVTTPIGLKTIEAYAFRNASSLTSVIHRDTVAATNSVTVSSTGNTTYKSAVHTYDIPSYRITYDLGYTKVVRYCELGTLPFYDGPTPKKTDPKYIYWFTGWDKPFTAVTGEALYNAQYIRLDALPVLELESGVLKTGDRFTVTVKADNFANVSAFSFDVNYQEYAGQIEFVGYSCETPGVNVEDLGGRLQISRDAGHGTLSGDLTLLELHFIIVDRTVRQADFIFNPTLAPDQGIYGTDGSQTYSLPVDAVAATVSVNLTPIADPSQDFNGDGSIDVSDVTALLNILANQHEGSGINAGFSIVDVTRLLDLLAA